MDHLARLVDDLLDVTRITRGKVQLHRDRVGGRVTLTLEQAEDRVRLCVRDCGVGIAPALLERIFEPFTRVDETLDHSRGGLGCGLHHRYTRRAA